MILNRPPITIHHSVLETTFRGVEHAISTPDVPIQQFRGIKYATIPLRFRQSKLFDSYPSTVDATKYGPICPQPNLQRSVEEEFIGLPDSDIPRQVFKHDEFDCLNLNITCPANANSESRLPVMVWVHGGGNRGSGSSWVYDGGALVRKSICVGKPMIMVTFNFRLGFFGFAGSPALAEDNKTANDDGAGNYGLRDQRKALEWIHHYIADFGGDPSNVTLFGSSTGAADIVHHLYSSANQQHQLFARAIIQSAIVDYNAPDIHSAGWQFSRATCSLRINSVDQMRAVPAELLADIPCPLRAIDDGVFFRRGWRDALFPKAQSEEIDRLPLDRNLSSLRLTAHKTKSKSRSPHPSGRLSVLPAAIPGLQPLIIGDCGFDSYLWADSASQWSGSGVVRRLRAICQSLTRATALLNAYDITSYTPPDELPDRVLELVNDARVAWPTECVAQAAQRSGSDVWRFVFDQEGPTRGIPHHAADLIYLFDNVPLPLSPTTSPMCFDVDESLPSLPSSQSSSGDICDIARRTKTLDDLESMDFDQLDGTWRYGDNEDGSWSQPIVDEWTYGRVRDAIQERWIAFACGERPWSGAHGKVFVFGPEGETGERSAGIFRGRRRRAIWDAIFKPLGMGMVQKVGVELSNGPGFGGR